MKALFIILSLLFIENSCSQSKMDENSISLEYTISSRSGYKFISINKQEISITTKRGKTNTPKIYKNNQWNKIAKALKQIKVENISSFKAPTKKRLYDGAAIANLKIIYKDTTYKAPSFDHGYPNKHLAKLINEIVSITQNIE